METPDFLVQDDVYEHSVFNSEEIQRNPQETVGETRDEYAEYNNSIFDSSRLNIKVEQAVDIAESVIDATDDENVAVEALRSLSGARPIQLIHCCPRCNSLKSSREELEEHLSTCQNQTQNDQDHANAKPPQHHCPICKESFEKLNELNNHIVCHASSRPHACRICGSLFLQKQDLHNHLVTHGILQSHQCKHCGQQFTRMSALTNHMKIHSYTAGRALVDKIGDTNELEDILTGNSDPEMEAVDQSRPSTKLVLPSINNISNISMTSSTAWAINYESEAYNGMNLSDINPNIPNINDNHHLKPDITPNTSTSSLTTTSTSTETSILETSTEADVKRPYKCDKCNKSFAREKAYINHINNVNNHFTCDRCDQHFSSQRALEGHKRYCGNNAANEVKSRVTFKNDDKSSDFDPATFEKRYKHVCEVCSKRFSTKQKLFRHVWIHRKKLHICEICSESFEDQKLLDAHRKEKHPSGGPYDCGECGKNFCSRQGLWEHSRTHTKDITHFKCEECDKTFTSRQGFLIHKRKHSDERPYGCKYCMKSFRDGGTLRKHERIHTGERPHACPVCSKTFNQKVVLREHVRWLHANTSTENQDGLFSCQLCASTFAEKDELSAHYMKHSDQLAQIAKEASKSNISTTSNVSSISITTSPPKRTKVENDVSMVQCDVEINEEEIPLITNYEVNNRDTEVSVESTYFEMTRVPPDGSSVIDYKPKIKVRELLRSPEVKMEFEQNGGTVDFECDMCSTSFDNKEDLSRHVSVHM